MHIIINKGVDNIEFGMLRQKVKEYLGEPDREFKRNMFSKNTTDYFINLGILIEYTQDNEVESIHLQGCFIERAERA
jgi:outer membrane protein assembly factor BamE (lipoprotein component of BamABCDE complex)